MITSAFHIPRHLPAGFPLIVLGKIIGNTVMSLLTLVISLVTAALLFHVPLSLADPFLFTLAMAALIISFVVI